MNIFKKLWNWVRSLFRKQKKEEKRYELVSTLFSTEFDIVGRGPSAWNSHAGGRYVDYIGFRRLECVREGDGYRCAAIKTREAYGDGKFVCEARFKSGKGTWPAIWMSHPDGSRDNFATYYEVDLSEYYETRDNTDTSYHFPASMRKEENFRHTATPVIKDGWNKFECTWDDEAIRVRVNGQLALKVTNNGDSTLFPVNEEDRTFQIILSMQAGSKWLQSVDLDELPLWMDIRNLKIYKLVK